jgi:soluble P-type ATPase
MINLSIPGNEEFNLKYLVLDYNGTMARDGELLDGVRAIIEKISEKIEVHVITADTFGHVRQKLEGLDAKVIILEPGQQDIAKKNYIQSLGAQHCVCIGNGRNDHLMLKYARLGIALIQEEGASTVTLDAADIVCTRFSDAIQLLLNKGRITATLRL